MLKTEELEELIRKAAKLDRIFGHINSCRVIVEKVQKASKQRAALPGRLDIKIPLVMSWWSVVIHQRGSSSDVAAEIRWAFEAAARQTKELVDKLNGDVKVHPYQQVRGNREDFL